MFRNQKRPRLVGRIAVTVTAMMALSACGGVTTGDAGEGEFPNHNIRLTVGQAPGGSTDLIARAIANGSQDAFGVSMTVENQPGANGAIATRDVANRAADGYELVLLNASLITVTSMTVDESERVTLDELDVVQGLSQDDYIMVANAGSDLDTVEDVVNAGRTITFGTTGVGTASQLAQLLLFAEAGVEGNEVPFDSGGPALTAVMGNQVEITTIQIGEAMPQIEAGTIKPLVVFAPERLSFLPEVPTAIEAGYDIPVSQYRAIAMPAGADPQVLQTLQEGIQEIMASEEYQQFNEDNYLTPAEISGDEVETQWTELAQRYQQLVTDNDIDLGGSS